MNEKLIKSRFHLIDSRQVEQLLGVPTRKTGEAEAAETQNWLDFSLACQYLSTENHRLLDDEYDKIIGMLVTMQKYPDKWAF